MNSADENTQKLEGKLELTKQQQSMEEVVERLGKVEEENKELKERVRKVEGVVWKLEEEKEQNRSELNQLRESVDTLTKWMHRCHIQFLLNVSREKAFTALRNLDPPESPEDYPEVEDLVDRLYEVLNKDKFPPTKEAIKMFCDPASHDLES